MRYLFARHGETDWNIARRVQGTTDTLLNETGIKQAEELRNNLKRMNVDLFRIYSSYQKRAFQTAQIVGEGLQIPVKVISGLEEMNLGAFEGHTWEEIQEIYPRELAYWHENKRYNKTPGGESYQLVMERVFQALDVIEKEARKENAQDKDILILTHGAVIMTLIALRDNIPFEQSHTVEVANAKAHIFEANEIESLRNKL